MATDRNYGAELDALAEGPLAPKAMPAFPGEAGSSSELPSAAPARPAIDRAVLEKEVSDFETVKAARTESSKGLLGDWGKLDEAGQREWIAGEKAHAESEASFWDSVVQRVEPGVTSIRDFVGRQITSLAKTAADPDSSTIGRVTGALNTLSGLPSAIVGDWFVDKAARNALEARHRRALAEEMERGALPAPQYEAWRARVDDVARGVGSTLGSMTKGMAYTGYGIAYQNMSDAQKSSVHAIGAYIEEKSKAAFPADPARAREFSTALGEGAGSMVAFFGPALAARMLGAVGNLGAVAMSAGAGAAAESGQMVDEALAAYSKTAQAEGRASLTPEEERNATQVWLMGLGIGATEAAPFAAFLGGQSGRMARRVLMQMVEEGGQEYVQTILENAVAQRYYDPDRRWDDNAWTGLAVGSILGAKMQVAGEAAGAMRKRRDELAQPPAAAPTPETAPATETVRDVSPSLDASIPAGKGPSIRVAQPDPVIDEARAIIDEVAPPAAPVAPAAPVTIPSFAEVLAVLPKDEAGDPDVGALIERVTEFGAKAWGGLSPEQKTEVFRRFAPVVEQAAPVVERVAEAVQNGATAAEVVQQVAEAVAAPPVADVAAQPAAQVAPASRHAPARTPAQIRAAFDQVLASKAKRSDWAAETGVDQAELDTLISEALKDGRLKKTKAGAIVRTAKAKATGQETGLPAAPGAATTAAMTGQTTGQPTVDRPTEVRANASRNDLARRYALDIAEAPNTESVSEIIGRLRTEKKGTNPALNEIVKILTGRSGKARTKAASYAEIESAAARRLAKRPRKPEIQNAIAQAFRDDAGRVPEEGLPAAVPGDAGLRPAEGAPDAGGSRGDGDVGGSRGADGQRAELAGELPGAGEDARGDTGAGEGDGERGANPPPAAASLTEEQQATVAAQVAADIERQEKARRDRETLNYQITDADQIGKGGPKAKVRGNIEAIRVLRRLQEEKRPATVEEKAKLVKYVGWGMFSQDVFADYKPEWKAERDALKDLLTPAEYAAARASTINAHYTSPEVIRAMWDGLKHMGFQGGRVLEPSAGIGHFIGLTPPELRADTAWTAVELDILSGEITKALYGAADVRVGGFEAQKWPDNHFDLAISNVPFASDGPYDPTYKQKFTLHDYFFVKALDKVRPGGIVAFITSAGTLDKTNPGARRAMDERGTFLGAVRLPGGNAGAFKANAGTDVTTDIVFFRKKIVGEPARNPEWLTRVEVKTPDKSPNNPTGTTEINGYFAANPDAMLGKMRLIGSMYGKGEPVLIGPTDGIETKIVNAITDKIPAGSMIPRGISAADMPRADLDTATDGIKEGSFYEKEGTLYRKVQGVGEPQKLGADSARKVRGFIGLRNVVNEMLAKQARGDRRGMDDLREALGKAYDTFVKAHGPINRTIISKQTRKDGVEITTRKRPTFALFRDDPDAYKVAAIEVYDEKTDTAKKAAIFNQDIVGSYQTPPVTGPADALAVSLNETGKVDIPLIARRLGLSEPEAISALGDQIFENPAGEVWETRAEYLSGDVVEKLDAARAAAELDPVRYTRNAEALEKAQPEPLTRAEVAVTFGAPWVPAEVYADFLQEVIGASRVKVVWNEKNARWNVLEGYFPLAANDTWGTNRRDVKDVIEAALNSETITITDTVRDGSGGETRVRQPEAEAEVRAKVTAVRDAFSGNPEAGIEGWVWADMSRADRLEKIYNHAFNRIVPQQYDGSHLTFPGLARVVTFPDGGTGTINLLPHRVNAVWRIIQRGNTLLNHVVGSGKAQPLDAKVLTPKGWKRMGDVRVGDLVVSANGKPTRVVGVFPQGEKDIYRVSFSDGSSTECCDEHLWLTQTYRERGYAQRARKAGKAWACGQGKVRALSEIRASLSAAHLGAKNHSIPIVQPVEFASEATPLDPYLVGVLIGDGCLTHREVLLSSADQGILDRVRAALPPECEVRHRAAHDYAIVYTGRVAKQVGGGNAVSHPVRIGLESVGLWGKYAYEKRIPAAYRYNTAEVRVAVLRGLMDTDGTVGENGIHVSFSTSSPGLADDVTEIVQSLGGVAFRSRKRIADARDAHILTISMPPAINPFLLERKASRVVAKSKYGPARYITAVDLVGRKPAQCIAVDDPSHLYVTDDFIVTHNTWTSIMASMEMKRLGMVQRPMFVVPNHMLDQFSTEFYQAYPNAKLLIASKDQMSKDRRREFAAKAASDTWDGIIITHSAFTRVGMQAEAYRSYYQDELDALIEAKDRAAQEEGKDAPTVKDLEKAKKRLEAKLQKLTDEAGKDEGVTFEELGVDFLFVDEAHLFKSLHFATRHGRVKGISNKGESKRATDLYVKMKHLEKSRPGRSAVFMTGTPVSNTMAELYTMQRYLQGPLLRKYGIAEFDAWARTFGQIVTKSELASNSRDYVDTESFSQFVNVPELMSLVGEIMDTQTAEKLNLPRPKLKNGRIEAVESDLSPTEEAAIGQLLEEMEQAKGKKPGEGTPFISLFTKGIQLATDMRLVDPDAEFNPNGKIGKAVGKIFDIWQEGNADPAAPNKAQIVFLDMGVPGSKGKASVVPAKGAKGGVTVETDIADMIRKDLLDEARGTGEEAEAEEIDEAEVAAKALLVGKFNLYADIKERLVAKGIPADQIAFIHDANTDDKKAKLFEKVRNGEVRVLLGSTGKMGVGTNVQRQLIAMHHLDAPWKPADVEQRDGRILRQGNKNPEVRILRYITKRSFDAYRWQLLDRKSNFIAQVFAGALGVRNAEDIDPPLPEAAELKAAATGNPLIMEHAELVREVRQLEIGERGHFRSQKQAGENAASAREMIAYDTEMLAPYEADQARVQDVSGDKFRIEITLGRAGAPITVTERKKAGEALRKYIFDVGSRSWGGYGSSLDLGRLSGFEVQASVKRTHDGLQVTPQLVGSKTYAPMEPFLITETSDPVQLVRRWERLVSGISEHVETVKARIARMESQIPALEAASQPKPYPRAAELRRKKARLQRLEAVLKPGKGLTADEQKAEAAYVDQGMANLKATSRTAAGVVDTSASAGKADKIAEGLTGEAAAQAATDNFAGVLRSVYRQREQLALLSPEALAKAVDQIALDVNRGILKEGTLYRDEDGRKYPYTAVADLPVAYKQFFEELSERLNDETADPVETAAWIEWRANLSDHFWADSVGKTSKALAALPLMRAGLPLPRYRSNAEFFSYANKTRRNPKLGGGTYLDREWETFLAYYRTLMFDPVLDAPYFGLPDPPRTLPDGHPLLTPHWDDDPKFQDTSPERVAMRERLIEQRFKGKTPAPGGVRPIAYVMGGGGASGKGTVLHILRDKGHIGENFVELDPDSFKTGDPKKGWEGIPEYWEIDAAGDTRGAGVTHEESSYIYKAAQKRGMEGRYNLILDQTLGNPKKGEKLLQSLKDAGYEVRLIGVTVDPELAVKRAVARAQGKERRYVPLDQLLAAHKGFSNGFEQYAAIADDVILFDTNVQMGDDPISTATKKPGQKLEILDQNTYLNFARKGALNEKATTLRELRSSIRGERLEKGADGGDPGRLGQGGRGSQEGPREAGSQDGPSLPGERLTNEGRGNPALSDSWPVSAATGSAVSALRRNYDFIVRQVRAGKRVPISESVTNALLEAAWPHMDLVPDGGRVAALAAVRPITAEEKRRVPQADSVGEFRSLDGEIIATPLRLGSLLDYRAAFDRRNGAVLLFGVGRGSVEGITEAVMRSRIAHESVHAVWQSLPRGVKSRLVRHARTLGVLDMQLGTVLRAIGERTAGTQQEQETLSDIYAKQYANAPDLDDRMAQESVAHLRELVAAGFFMDAELSPIAGDMALLDGVQEGMPAPRRPETLMAALQASQERATLARHFGAVRIEDIGPADPHPGRVLAFHGTEAADFDQLDLGKMRGFGIHFGSADLADLYASPSKTVTTARVLPAVLDLRNVITLPDMDRWDAASIAKAVEASFPFAAGLGAEIAAAGDARVATETLRQRLTDVGVQGLRYWNEGVLPGWAYIVWEPGHVISATSGEMLFAVQAYHGTPHNFDRFDLSKVGTGDGNASYGYGLNFTESEDTAKHYRDTLVMHPRERTQAKLAIAHLRAGGKGEAAPALLAYVSRMAFRARPELGVNPRPQDLADFIERTVGGEGHLYEVRINAEPDDFIDWDKPIGEQSEKVQIAFDGRPMTPVFRTVGQPLSVAERRGESAYNSLAEALGRPYDPKNPRLPEFLDTPAASQALRESGIAGIVYKDGSSGKRNYVVFDDSLIEIVAKDGVPVTPEMLFAVGGGIPRDAESTFPSGKISKSDRLGGSEVFYSRNLRDSSEVYIESLETQRGRGKGNARKLMEDLTARADAEGITLVLDAAPQDEATDEARLRAFYASLGFRHVPASKAAATYLMRREPVSGRRQPTPAGIAQPAPAADEEGSAPSLNAVIQKLKDSLGVIPTQTLLGVTIRAEDGSEVRLNPQRNVRGQTQSATGAVGVRKSRAIDVIAHEMGHALEVTLGGDILDLQQAHAATLQAFAPGATLSEAWADWFSHYVMSGPHAKATMGPLVEAFEDVIEANSPEMLEGLHEAQALYQDWLARATPEALASDVVSTYAGNSWTELAEGDKSLSEAVSGKLAGAYAAVIDELAPVQQMVRRLLSVADRNGVRDEVGRPISLAVGENPYKVARMFRGSYATGYSWLKNGIANRGETTISFPGLAKALETLFGSADQQDWDQQMYQTAGNYLIARRAVAEYDRLEAKAVRIADIESVMARGEIARATAADARDKARGALERREAALIRAETRLRDRSSALKAAEAEVRRLQERIQDKKDDVLAAQMARDGSLASRRQRDLANLERQSAAALGAAAAIRDEYDALSTDVALLNAEIQQRREQVALAERRTTSIERAVASLGQERKFEAERGASRPPTREPKEHWLDVIAKTEADPKYARIKEFAAEVYAYTSGLLALRRQAGLISDELYRELVRRKDWYVPFQRDMSDASAETVFGGGMKKWSPFKKFDGSDRAIINPLEVLASDAYATAQQIAFNDAANALASLAERAGPGAASIAHVLTREEAAEANAATFDRIRDVALAMGIDAADADRLVHQMETNFAGEQLSLTWSPATQGPVSLPQIPVWRNGERTMIRLTDPEIGTDVLNAMSGMGKETASWLTEFFATPARLLQMGITTHPTFMPRNLFRDIFDAWIKTGALPILTQVKGARTMRDPEFMRRYYEAGGIVGGRNVAALTSAEQQKQVLDLGERRISKGSIVLGAVGGGLLGTLYGGPIGGVAGALAGGYALRRGEVLKAVEAAETMTRVGVAAYAYKRALEHNPDLSETEAMLEAAFVARDVFDWNRRGSKMVGVVRAVTFLNAQIQGLDAAFRKLGGESDRGMMLSRHLGMVWRRENGATLSADEERELGNAYKTWARMGIYTLGLLSLYALATSGDDEDDKKYQDIRDKTKATHSWLPNVFGVDVRLPKAFEWAMPANIIEAIADKIRGRDPRVWDRVVDSTYEVMAPPLVPQAANLIVGLATNAQLENLAPWVKRLLGRDPENVSNRQVVGDQLARLDPESQFDAFSSQLSIDIAKGMTAAGVPRDLVPSPKKIDFVLRSGGYWGQDIAKGYGIVREGLGFRPREAPRVSDLPVIGGFTGVAARQSKSRDELMQLMAQSGGQLATAAATYKQLIDEEGSPADAERLLSRLNPEERAYTLLTYYGAPQQQKDHPLERLLSVDRTLSKIRKDMILDRLTPVRKEGRKTVRDFEEKITLSPRKQTEVHEIIERLQQAEAWNTMVLMKRPGWEGKSEIAVKPILDELKASSAKVHELYEDRLQATRAREFSDVKADWPELRERILREGKEAF